MALLCSCSLMVYRSRHSSPCLANFENRPGHSITLIWEGWEPECRHFALSLAWRLSLPSVFQGLPTSLLSFESFLAPSKTQHQAPDLTNFKLSVRSHFGGSLSPQSTCYALIGRSSWENLNPAGNR